MNHRGERPAPLRRRLRWDEHPRARKPLLESRGQMPSMLLQDQGNSKLLVAQKRMAKSPRHLPTSPRHGRIAPRPIRVDSTKCSPPDQGIAPGTVPWRLQRRPWPEPRNGTLEIHAGKPWHPSIQEHPWCPTIQLGRVHRPLPPQGEASVGGLCPGFEVHRVEMAWSEFIHLVCRFFTDRMSLSIESQGAAVCVQPELKTCAGSGST